MMPVRLPRTIFRTAFAATIALALAGCASGPRGAEEVNDPLEVPNRFVFAANEAVDILVVRPAAEVYQGVVPDPVRNAVHNVLQNLLAPLVIGNSLLQGDVQNASNATGRFLTNTILGLGGVLDVATEAGVPPYRLEDFGQTLGVWGVGEGPYLVLPLIGRSNARDAVGFGVDTLADPFRIGVNATTSSNTLLYTRTGASVLDTRQQILREVDDLRRNSVDFYATARALNTQQRNAAIRNGGTGADAEFPDFDEPPPAPAVPKPLR